jgi:Patatin-like phospholipase
MANTERRLALTIKGGVSLGTYEAGAISELLSLIKYNNQQPGAIPWYIDCVAGASAGSITAAMLARALINTDAVGPNGTMSDAVLQEIWVSRLALDVLAAGAPNTSILSSDAVRQIGNDYFAAWPAAAAPHPAFRTASGVSLVFTLSALDVEPIAAQAANGALLYNEYAATARFDLTIDNANAVTYSGDGTALYNYNTPGNSGMSGKAAYDALTWAAISSGAFPLAFAPHSLARYENLLWKKRWFSDGGIYDNDPVGEMINLAHDMDWNPNKPPVDDSDRRFLVILTEPQAPPDVWPPDGAESATDLLNINPLDMLAKLLPGFMEQTMNSGLRGITQVNQSILKRAKIISNLVSVLNTTASSFDFAALRNLVRPIVERVAEYQKVSPSLLALIQNSFIDDLRGLPDDLQARATALGIRPNVKEAFVEMGLLVDLAAGLADKVLFRPIVVGPTKALAGDPLEAFSGFFLQRLRQHDFDQGAADAYAAMRAVNDPDFALDPNAPAPPADVVLSAAEQTQYNNAEKLFNDRVGVVADTMAQELAGRIPGASLPIFGKITRETIGQIVKYLAEMFLGRAER